MRPRWSGYGRLSARWRLRWRNCGSGKMSSAAAGWRPQWRRRGKPSPAPEARVPAAAPPPDKAPAAAPPKVAPPAGAGVPAKRPRAKPKKREVPARIISLPPEGATAPVVTTSVTPPAATPATPPGLTSGARKAAPPSGSKPAAAEKKPEVKGKKKGKRVEVGEMPARGKPVKKREVRERADLYGLAEGEGRSAARRRGMKRAIKKISRADLTVPKAIKRRIKGGESTPAGVLCKG